MGFGEGFGKVLGRSGSLLGALGASQGFFVAVLAHVWVVQIFFNFLVIFVVCGYFGLLWDVFVECGLLGFVFCVLLSAGFLGAIGTSQRVLGVLDRFYLVFSTSSRREARAQRASRGTKEGRVERKSGKMRKRLSLSLPGFFFCSSRSLLSIVFSLRRLWHFLVSGFPVVLSPSLSFPRFPLPCLAFSFFTLW